MAYTSSVLVAESGRQAVKTWKAKALRTAYMAVPGPTGVLHLTMGYPLSRKQPASQSHDTSETGCSGPWQASLTNGELKLREG